MIQILNPRQIWLGTVLLLVLQLFFQEITLISVNIIGMSLASIWLAFSSYSQFKFTPVKIALIALFLMNLSGLGSDAGRFEIEKKLSLLLFPLLFSMVELYEIDLKKIYKIFFISCLIGLTYIYSRLGIHFLETHELLAYHEILEGTSMHPSYCCLYLLTGMFGYAVLLTQNEKHSKGLVFKVLGILFAIVPFLALSAAKLQILNYLVCLGLFFVFTRKQISIWIPLSALLLIAVAMGIALKMSPQVQDRMRDISQAKQEIAPNDTNQTSTSARKYMWQSALKVVAHNPVLGVGAGNEAKALMKEYTAIDFQFGMYHNTDAHNQLLATSISHGLVGAFILLFIIIFPFTQKRFTTQPLFWLFYVPVTFTAMVESIFGVQKGIVFFCLFLMIFDSLSTPKEQKKAGAS